MAEGFATAYANKALDALCGNANWTNDGDPWIKLHVGAPGASGTSNPATETTRKQCSFAAASSGSIASDAALTWTSVAGTEDYTHFTAWTASTAGTFMFSGTITANSVTTGDTFTAASGGLTTSLTVAS